MWDLNSLTRAQTCIPCIGRLILNHWTTREVPNLNFLNEADNFFIYFIVIFFIFLNCSCIFDSFPMAFKKSIFKRSTYIRDINPLPEILVDNFPQHVVFFTLFALYFQAGFSFPLWLNWTNIFFNDSNTHTVEPVYVAPLLQKRRAMRFISNCHRYPVCIYAEKYNRCGHELKSSLQHEVNIHIHLPLI